MGALWQTEKSDRLQLPARAITHWRSHVGKWLLETRARLNTAKGDKVGQLRRDRFWPSKRDNLLGRLNCLRAARCQFRRRALHGKDRGRKCAQEGRLYHFVTNRWLLQAQGMPNKWIECNQDRGDWKEGRSATRGSSKKGARAVLSVCSGKTPKPLIQFEAPSYPANRLHPNSTTRQG